MVPTRHAYTLIDAGISCLRLLLVDESGRELHRDTVSVAGTMDRVLRSSAYYPMFRETPCFVTGRFAHLVGQNLARAVSIESMAAFWAGATARVGGAPGASNLAVIEISASGYRLIGVNGAGKIERDLYRAHPKCGAGSGVNLTRILEKLAVRPEGVDELLGAYTGEAGTAARRGLTVRADRCGVFSSSATVSDKNQGIPLDFALATTIKSEVYKACSRLVAGFDKACLTGGFFAWRFARDCAVDYLEERGVTDIELDEHGTLALEGLNYLVRKLGVEGFRSHENDPESSWHPRNLPGLTRVREILRDRNAFHRIEEPAPVARIDVTRPLCIALDVGSTMAKAVIADGETGQPLVFKAYNNHGDTIDTIKRLFRDFAALGLGRPRIQHIAVTGSARYQVRKSLVEVYPQVADRTSVLVENYAHARGAIEHARSHLDALRARGVEPLDRRQVILVDVGGEDTKISTISLDEAELSDNAMNVKCSAGTGSLMDSLALFFGIGDIAEAARRALDADKAFQVNATCAVFLWENARRLQARGEDLDEILASSVWAVVENMARSLWNQIDLPPNAVTILVGQTMLSDALPVAVVSRLRDHLQAPTHGLVPPHAGHNACLGLIRTFARRDAVEAPTIDLADYVDRVYEKRIVQCRGAACGDPEAVCNRAQLRALDGGARRYAFTLGGCSAINEMLGTRSSGKTSVPDHYKNLWRELEADLPKSEAPNRLVIPRAFSVSEWAPFFARFFQHFEIPIHVDNIRSEDVLVGQKYFSVDTCAPHIGAAGQFQRLAAEPHGYILAPQIEFLPSDGQGLARTCTTNQGGMVVARSLALENHPTARIHLFYVNLKHTDMRFVAGEFYTRLKPVFHHYQLAPPERRIQEALAETREFMRSRNTALQDRVAAILEGAADAKQPVVIVAAREYILTPGIYDSHVGRLLHDKGMIGIPSYALGLRTNPEFGHLYWRNPHLLVSLAAAAAQREVHRWVEHPRLSEALRRLESKQPNGLPLLQVSTFRCGPDSVIAHTMSALMRDRPFLLIQSDAAIKELAHLENRVNTFSRQLGRILEAGEFEAYGETFQIATLDRLNQEGRVDPKLDVLYFPTLSDNRFVTAVLRGAGFAVIDNYRDDTYDLATLVARGRESAGDTVCAPLAAVYGDVLSAIEDFSKRKQRKDPLVAGKRRLLIFNNKGLGPCRQGQYVEVHKLLTARGWHQGGASRDCPALAEDSLLQFAVGRENEGYDIGLDRATLLRAFQGGIVQGVAHQIYANGALRCRDSSELKEFASAFQSFKQGLFEVLEGPGPKPGGMNAAFWTRSVLSGSPSTALRDRQLIREIRRFTANHDCRPVPAEGRLRIHVEGEVYMRVAQFQSVLHTLIEILGFGRFILTYSPLWSYLDYKLAGKKMRARESFREAVRRLLQNPLGQSTALRLDQCINRGRRRLRIAATHGLFRTRLAAPLYRAAGIPLPESMSAALENARRIIPTLRPGGELAPYVGETISKLLEGYDLVLNVAPEGCMVAGMGEGLTPAIVQEVGRGQIQHLFSDDGDVNREALIHATLKILGPERFYASA